MHSYLQLLAPSPVRRRPPQKVLIFNIFPEYHTGCLINMYSFLQFPVYVAEGPNHAQVGSGEVPNFVKVNIAAYPLPLCVRD